MIGDFTDHRDELRLRSTYCEHNKLMLICDLQLLTQISKYLQMIKLTQMCKYQKRKIINGRQKIRSHLSTEKVPIGTSFYTWCILIAVKFCMETCISASDVQIYNLV